MKFESGGKDRVWENVPEGGYAATCIDVFEYVLPGYPKPVDPKDLGKRVKIRFHVRVTNPDGTAKDNVNAQPWIVDAMYRPWMGQKSFLRRFLETWLGPLGPEAEEENWPDDVLVNHDAYVVVEHFKKTDGRVFANVKTAVPIPPGMKGPGMPPDYIRVIARELAPQRSSAPKEDLGF